jgi:hypothetical protein
MALIQARYFVLANGNNPTNCTVDSNTQVKVEIIAQSDYRPGGENLTMLEATVVIAGTNNCIKKFRWTGSCLLGGATTYTFDSVAFTLPIGSYNIQIGSAGSPSSTGTQCNITLPLVVC